MRQRAYVGIDPGKRGAAALISDNMNCIDIFDWSNMIDVDDNIRKWNAQYHIVLAVIEKVHSMPGQGVASMFTFGTNYGFWQGIIMAKMPHILISPQKWQKEYLNKDDGKNTKERSYMAAKRLYPNADIKSKNFGRADALLMATYASKNGLWDKIKWQ